MILVPAQLIPPELADTIADNLTISVIVLALYVAAFLFVSYLARRHHVPSVSDHIVASRGLGWVVTTITIIATAFSGVGLAGFPGTTYIIGAAFLVAVLTGFAATTPAMWFVGRRMWRLGKEYGFETPGDLLGEYYGSDLIRVFTAIVSVLFNLTYIVAQFLAGGILIHVLTGGLITFSQGVLITGVIIFLHVTLTGLRGIAYLDTFNGSLILTILIVFVVYIFAAADGLTGLFTGLPDGIQEAHYTLPGVTGGFTAEIILTFGIVFTWGTYLTSPAVWIRVYSFDRPESLVKIVGGLLVFLTVAYGIGLHFIGTFSRIVFPQIENPDFASSLLAFEVLPFVLAVVFLAGILAAVISTGDSYLHAISATVTRDFVNAVLVEELSEARELQINYGLIFVSMLIGLVFALTDPGLITPLAAFAGAFTVMLLPPLIGAVAWPRASSEAAIVAITVGIVLIPIYQFTGLLPNPYPVPLAPGLLTAFAANIVLFVGISLVTRPVPRDRLEKFHGLLHREL